MYCKVQYGMSSMQCKMPTQSKTGACELSRRRECKQAKLLACFHLMICLVQLVACQQNSLGNGSSLPWPMFLESPGGVFRVGITSLDPSAATPAYMLAIYYAKAANNRVVWVSERVSEWSSTNASFALTGSGELRVYDNSGDTPRTVWNSTTGGRNVVNATILDTGNLVLLDTDNEVVWESFDSPTDTLLPNQVFKDGGTITAWENVTNWSSGNYTLTYKSSFIVASWKSPYPWEKQTSDWDYWNSSMQFTSATLTPDGAFQGVSLSGINVPIGSVEAPTVVRDRLFRLTLDFDGNLRMYSWAEGNTEWKVEWTVFGTEDLWGIPGFCGPYSICEHGKCRCPLSFEFVNTYDHRLGCRRQEPPAHSNFVAGPTDTFSIVSYVDYPGNDLQPNQPNVTLAFCKEQCLASSKCVAFISSIPEKGPDDLLADCWLKKEALLRGEIDDYKRAYLRVGAGSLQSPAPALNNAVIAVLATLTAAVVVLALLCCSVTSLFVAQKIENRRRQRLLNKWLDAKGTMIRFSYREIQLMTTNFAVQIGEGGYGTVFKGQIGQNLTNVTVAVKRLNKRLSNHVEKDFLNEVGILGLIHHVHLVSLLGYCTDAQHRILVYEYISRGSLDRVLFRDGKNSGKIPTLEWNSRLNIAVQTARGLAYLHEDCKKWIIHCDVKPENILLDSSYCVKVADFGLSRIRSRDQMTPTRSKTMNIRGTLGYLAPEYWLSDHISISNKVDVFSYGMVLLEIISGRRNVLRAPPNPEFMDSHMDAPYFPMWAFPKLETEAFLDVLDPAVSTAGVDSEEVRRALRVAFWCIAEKPQHRPSMSEVVQKLQGHMAIELPVPRPAYFDTLQLGDDNQDCNRSEESRILLSSISSSV